ncbi:MAG: secretin N-terminal domain-containing protein, partial [Acidiferrobacteraceae bacterium]
MVTLAQSIDAPPLGARYTQVYRLQRVDATSVGDLVARSYPQAHITVDKALNAISVLGTAAEQARIAAAIAQLDGAPTSGTSGNAGAAYGTGNIAVVDLNSAMPGQNGSPSTTAQDIASAVQQALQALAPGLRITVPANSAQIVLAGSPPSIRLAQGLIARLDRPQPLVVLDTEVLEVDENAAKNIGLQFPGAVVQSQFDEILPTP